MEEKSTNSAERQYSLSEASNLDPSPPKARTDEPISASDDDKVYPPLKKVIPAMIAIYLVFFLVALDRTIVGTAIPSISSEFDSFGDIGWYESAFLLPLCVLQLSCGLLYKFYSTKWLLFTLTAIFEVGSIICAAAPTSDAFIIGRAITGIGGAGIGTGAYLLITLLVPLHNRPKYLGSLGAVFGVSSILGPILGGYLTSVTWRWCFWINVPIGGVALVLTLLLAPATAPPSKAAETWRRRLLDLDPIGFLLVAGSITCLLFALEYGGEDQSWTEGRVVALFVVFAVLLVGFVGFQAWRGEKATVPPRIISQRSIIFACLLSFSIGSLLVIYAFYLPIWFQVVQGRTPQSSGLNLLPLLLSNVFSVIASGILIGKLGYYTTFSIAGGAILVIGSALVTTWTVDISEGKRIGYLIITGIGLGLGLQVPNVAAQTVLADSDYSIGTTVVNVFTFLGGTVFVTVSQTLLEGQLNKKLKAIVPNLDPSLLAGSGATSLSKLVPADKLHLALEAYNDSMKAIWYLGLGLACLTFVAAFGLEWKNVKTAKRTVQSGQEDAV